MDEENPVVDEQVTDIQPEQPESDPILEALGEDDDAPSDVIETPAEEEAETETPAEGEQPAEEEQEAQSELDPKEVARQRFEERQLARQQRESTIRETGAEYVKNGEDEYDQRLRSMEVERYNEKVSANEDRLIGEFERVKASPELQIFNPESEEFNQRAYLKAIKDFDAGYVQRDELNNIQGLKGSLIEHLKETADLMRGAQKSGAVQQVRASRQMKQSADIKPAATPKETQKDAILEALKSDD